MAGSIGDQEGQAMDFEFTAPQPLEIPSEEMQFREDIHPKERLLTLEQRMTKLLKDLDFLNAPMMPTTRSGKQQICLEYNQKDIPSCKKEILTRLATLQEDATATIGLIHERDLRKDESLHEMVQGVRTQIQSTLSSQMNIRMVDLLEDLRELENPQLGQKERFLQKYDQPDVESCATEIRERLREARQNAIETAKPYRGRGKRSSSPELRSALKQMEQLTEKIEEVLDEGNLKKRSSEEDLLLERLEALHISIEPDPSNQPHMKKGRIEREDKD